MSRTCDGKACIDSAGYNLRVQRMRVAGPLLIAAGVCLIVLGIVGFTVPRTLDAPPTRLWGPSRANWGIDPAAFSLRHVAARPRGYLETELIILVNQDRRARDDDRSPAFLTALRATAGIASVAEHEIVCSSNDSLCLETRLLLARQPCRAALARR